MKRPAGEEPAVSGAAVVRAAVLVVLALTGALLLSLVAGCAPALQATAPQATAPDGGTATSTLEATLLRVVDGDTIWVRLGDGTEEKVRYIGLDAPEVAHVDAPGEYLGEEAKAHNARLLESGRLRLQTDVETRDSYGRLLAYVWSGEVLVNESLILDGYARAHNYPPNLTRQAQLQEAQAKARQAHVGLWAPR